MGNILLYLKANCETFGVSANGFRAILLQKINNGRYGYEVTNKRVKAAV
jgi:hypothetical protein